MNLQAKVVDIQDQKVILRDKNWIYYLFYKKDNQEFFLYQNVNLESIRITKIDFRYQIANVKFQNISKAKTLDLRYFLFLCFQNKSQSYNNLVLPIFFGFFINSNNELVENLKNLDSLHLIIVSGFHYLILEKLIEKITTKFDKNGICIVVLLTFYFWIGKSNLASFKSWLWIISLKLSKISRWTKQNSCKFQRLSTISLIHAFYNPLHFLKIGFLISYLLTFYLISGFLNFEKKELRKKLFLILKAWTLSVLFLISISKQFSLFGILSNLILSFVFEILIVILLPCLFIPFLIDGFYLVILNLLKFLNSYNVLFVFNTLLSYWHLVLLFVYLDLIYLIRNKKY
ncbi:ComEC/Rec2 family competence protein [Mycoplasmopsis gallopavonis]|uniref:ComEC/Rec2-related protein domain-containing protein n=1 Tax=Mycoplasmopsis gallopavonis TaxID=76629 RepID=A0A449AZ01_9BACT|nr:ComEC/Rec2 family competence protein [Mycoplasmopsis gallopavonis]VEU72731.1 Uncharacterised protein [Mycoplasmopsis gallopavonis]